jgi:hypothetical protein
MGAPSGGVPGELLQDQQGSLATAQRDRLGDLGAGIVDRGSDSPYGPVADQVPDIGDHPRGARLDELILVELGEVVGDDGDLFLHEHQQGLERSPRQPLRLGDLGVAEPVYGREEREQVGAHVITPSRIFCGSGSRTRISAGRGSTFGVATGMQGQMDVGELLRGRGSGCVRAPAIQAL